MAENMKKIERYLPEIERKKLKLRLVYLKWQHAKLKSEIAEYTDPVRDGDNSNIRVADQIVAAEMKLIKELLLLPKFVRPENDNHVFIGDTVFLKGDTGEFEVTLGVTDINKDGISILSNLGSKLYGKEIGKTVTYKDSNTRKKVEITGIKYTVTKKNSSGRAKVKARKELTDR